MKLRHSIPVKSILLAVAFYLAVQSSVRIGSAQAPKLEVIVEGKVCNAAGEPVAGVSVKLENGSNSLVQETRTAANGAFVLHVKTAGIYKVRVEKEGYRTRLLEKIQLDPGKKLVDIILEKIPAAGAIEFSDSPNFTVAGVTDWSNVGLHGSDANVRTSEALSKETAALRPATAPAHPGGAGDAHRLLGDEKEKAGDPVGAVKEYEAAVKLDASEENYFAWGSELLLHRAGIAAAEVLRKGSELHPKSERMIAALGAAYYANGQYTEAAEQICHASDLNPADAEPYLFLGKMEQAASGITLCSEERLARFANEQPKNSQANFYYGLVLLKKARKTQREDDFDQAEKYFQRAIAADQNYGEVYLELGMMYNARGQKEAALAEFQKAVVVSPELGAAHYQLSLAHRRVGETAKADEEMKTYTRLRKSEEAALEKERREMRQFVTVLKQGSAPN
ncbi:MAG: carboxypeptidase regulatory-like domain-containing protein [Acidobacteria bacterium]|nr:carboxypeptidase regulatory-like domain-containing protein [Acidobacteriota bacterium]MBS1864939.1 carboxypeptidase regulatory-like domain-containing protein [Acidobacteriota bacterium]